MKALLITDVQNDFCPGGALPAPYGDRIIPAINKIMDKFSYIYASQDWHPRNTAHFTKWPVHCVIDTWGAKLHSELKKNKIEKILLKGTSNKDDGYSAFEASNLNFEEHLKKNKIDELYVTGLTTEYCVLNSVLDALQKGFKTYVIKDAIQGIDNIEGGAEKAIETMKQAGAKIIHSEEL